PVVAQDHRDLGDTELLGRFEPEVAIDHFAAATRQDRDLEPELLDRGRHSIDSMIVLPGIPGVWNEPADCPRLDLRLRGFDHHPLNNSSGFQSSTVAKQSYEICFARH